MEIGLLSFVVAAHNEVASLPPLLEEIRGAAGRVGAPFEIVVVDDGSTDGTTAWLERESREHDDLLAVHLPKNRGQSAAMIVGLRASRGEILVTLDADLQNDPADAVQLVAALEESDLACGVRAKRHDIWAKRVGSRIANRFRRWILKDRFRDVGCSLKAWRRPVAERMPPFRGFHRFIPILAEAEGFRVVELEVSHRPREHGETHYGQLSRALAGLRDLFGVAWLRSRRVDVTPPQDQGALDRSRSPRS